MFGDLQAQQKENNWGMHKKYQEYHPDVNCKTIVNNNWRVV